MENLYKNLYNINDLVKYGTYCVELIRDKNRELIAAYDVPAETIFTGSHGGYMQVIDGVPVQMWNKENSY